MELKATQELMLEVTVAHSIMEGGEFKRRRQKIESECIHGVMYTELLNVSPTDYVQQCISCMVDEITPRASPFRPESIRVVLSQLIRRLQGCRHTGTEGHWQVQVRLSVWMQAIPSCCNV